MSVEEHLVHTHHCTTIPTDTLKVWNSIAGDDPHIQIDQSNGVSAYVSYTADEAPELARAILTAAGLEADITIR